MSNDIIKFLGFEDDSIEIVNTSFKSNKRIITIQQRLFTHYCPACNHIMHSKGIYQRMVNHPVMQDGRQLSIIVNQRRWKCTNRECGYTQNDKFSFLSPHKRNTNTTDLLIVTAFKDYMLSASRIAKTYSVSDTYAINTFARYVDMPRRQLTEAICIDEVYVDIGKDCKYAMVIQDFLSGEPIDMLKSRRKDFTEPYFAGISSKERMRVKYLVTDMYKPYQTYTDIYFPSAVSVIDSFHVVKYINNKIHLYILGLLRKYHTADLARHESLEQKLKRRIEFTPSNEYYLLKKYGWLILKNNDDIYYSGNSFYNYKLHRYVTIGDLERMLFDIDPVLKELRDLKEKYIRFNRQYGSRYKEAKEKLNDIIQIYENCPYSIFHDVAIALKENKEGILNSFIMIEKRCQGEIYKARLSNGSIEAANRIVKDMKRNGRGYLNFEHLRNRVLYSQRANAALLGVPKTIDQIRANTGKKRGPYKKKE